jgi:hypothetical protein
LQEGFASHPVLGPDRRDACNRCRCREPGTGNGRHEFPRSNALQYGILDQTLNTETIIIAPNSSVSGTGTALILGGTQAAANLTVTATASQTLTILVDSIVNGTGYALSAFVCNYNSGTDTACNSYTPTSVASATLLIGATLTGDNLAVAGAADGSFNVTVAYQ